MTRKPTLPAVHDAAVLQAPINHFPRAADLREDSTDEEIQAVALRDPGLLQRAQALAARAHQDARMIRSGPILGVDRYWRDAQRQTMDSIAQAGGAAVIANRRAEGWVSIYQQFRIALRATEHFRSLVTRYATLPQHEVERLRQDDVLQGASYAMRSAPIAPGVVTAPPFNALPVLADLARRGIHVWASEGGTILARPGLGLTPKDRETITMHKVAILAALGDEVAVA